MKLVIVGGGFAGLNLAKALTKNQTFEITLVDKNNYHFFPPLIYQVATSFIEASNISYPFRKMFQDAPNVRFFNGVLLNINVAENQIDTDTGVLEYDILVLAMGTETNYFGMENVRKDALPMKTIDDALHLRNQLLLHLEAAARTNDEQEREKLTTIVIAGGGPTGVEVAGMLAEMGKHIINKDYPELGYNNGHIYLLDAGPTLLGPMSVKAQNEAIGALEKLGVSVKLNVAVKDFTDDTVLCSDGSLIRTKTLVWASGVVARAAPGLPSGTSARGGRLIVDECNKIVGTNNVFAIGDICYQTSDNKYPNGHPQLAQVAIQQAQLLAKNLIQKKEGMSMKAFVYKDKGSMAIIAKYKAVVDLPKGFFKGFFAWLTWLFIHIIPIAGFRNKFKLAFNWFWSFVTNDPTLRLIIRPEKEKQTQ